MPRVSKSTPGLRRPQPTLYDVATDAGVSAMSVSRVLNEGPNVSEDMRRKVMASVNKLGYLRNENARSLRRQATGLVGLIVTNIDNPYYAQLVLGVEDRLDSTGHRILVGISHGDVIREAKLVQAFIGRQVDGLIVVPSDNEGRHLAREAVGVPVVLASREIPRLQLDSVAIEDLRGAREGVSDLIRRGHLRIAFLGNHERVSTAQRRFTGYAEALNAAGIALDPDLVSRDCPDLPSARTAMDRILHLADPPTAVLCSNNQVTMGALEVLVPASRDQSNQPVEVLAFDSFELVDLIPHPISVIEHDPRAVGRSAARLLQSRLDDDEDTPPLRLLLPTSLRRGLGTEWA